MVNDYFEAWELVEVLDVDEVSAEEFLAGTLELETDEIIKLAEYKGISVDKLLR